MQSCEQITGVQTIWEHGLSVRDHLFDLISSKPQLAWRLPKWFVEHKDSLTENLHPKYILEHYTIFHDCGKPLCQQIDEAGRSHFPNHARISKQLYFAATGDCIVSALIGWDMVLHTATAKEVTYYLNHQWTIEDAVTLLLTALAEVHSNAAMFGGIESNSFKAKCDRRGRLICKYLKENYEN